jgi:hypothetical protein
MKLEKKSCLSSGDAAGMLSSGSLLYPQFSILDNANIDLILLHFGAITHKEQLRSWG